METVVEQVGKSAQKKATVLKPAKDITEFTADKNSLARENMD